MTKAEIVNKISSELGIEKSDVLAPVESFMSEVKGSLESGNNVCMQVARSGIQELGRRICP